MSRSRDVNRELQRLAQALDTMPVADREVFHLARFDGRDHFEIAASLGLTIAQVEAHLARAVFHLMDFDQPR